MLAVACAKPPPPVPFTHSEAFVEAQRDIAAYVRADLDDDGHPEAIAAVHHGPGFAVAVFFMEPFEETYRWHRGCTGEPVAGSELESLDLMSMGSRPWVLLMASESDPEEQVQSFVLADPADSCHSIMKERVRLPVPGYDVLAPGPVPAGLKISKAGTAIRILDQPQYLRLQGGHGELQVLASVRQRLLGGDGDEVTVEESTLSFLRDLEVSGQWLAGDAPVDLPQLGDGDDGSVFVVRAGERGALSITASAPITLIELHHGCPGVEDEPLHLVVDGSHYVTGEAPEALGFVRGTGRGHSKEAGRRSDLLALREATHSLSMRVGPEDTERCLRAVKAYGFVAFTHEEQAPEPATPPTAPNPQPAPQPKSEPKPNDEVRL